PEQAAARPHGLHRRPPPGHGPRRRPDRRDGGGPGRADGQARGPPGRPPRPLPPAGGLSAGRSGGGPRGRALPRPPVPASPGRGPAAPGSVTFVGTGANGVGQAFRPDGVATGRSVRPESLTYL